jgi:phosphoserine phosphatase
MSHTTTPTLQNQTQNDLRVVIEPGKIEPQSNIDPSKLRPLKSGQKSFVVTDHPSSELISRARAEMSTGNSAAVIPLRLLCPDAIFFDMDATVIAEESLVELATVAGKEKEVLALTEKAMAGGMDFKESLRRRLAILSGLRRDQVLGIQPTINPGMKTLADWCHQHNIPIFLVSGGFVDLAEPVAKSLGFLDFKANRFAWKDDRLTGDVDGEIVDGRGKCEAISRWCTIHHLDPHLCVAVGDGANDLPMMAMCGLAVGFSPKKTLWSHLDVANHTGDHSFLVQCLDP